MNAQIANSAKLLKKAYVFYALFGVVLSTTISIAANRGHFVLIHPYFFVLFTYVILGIILGICAARIMVARDTENDVIVPRGMGDS